jgi:hypothetical protein
LRDAGIAEAQNGVTGQMQAHSDRGERLPITATV